MLPLRTASPWVLLSLLALLSACSGARDRSRSKGATVTRAPRSAHGPFRGKFNLNDGMQCTWATRDAGDVARMRVQCENPQARIHGGVTDIKCEYRARPQSCPGFETNSKGYYKQVSRSLKKLQGKVCREERALVKAAMCKRAPRDAHFKLDIRSSVVAAQSGGDYESGGDFESTTTRSNRKTSTTTTTIKAGPASNGTSADCKGRADHRQAAKEYCNSSWASVCAFFFSMLQSDDC